MMGEVVRLADLKTIELTIRVTNDEEVLQAFADYLAGREEANPAAMASSCSAQRNMTVCAKRPTKLDKALEHFCASPLSR